MGEESFKERVVKEREELKVKLTALSNFLSSDKINSIPDDERERLRLQYGYMFEYEEILAERIKADFK